MTRVTHAGPGVSLERLAELETLFGEYAGACAPGSDERARLDGWPELRRVAQQNWTLLMESYRSGQDVAESSLWQLLPYKVTPIAKSRGAFCHPAAAFRDDPRTRFVGSGWLEEDDWPVIGRGLFEFVLRCDDYPPDLWQACEAFTALPGGRAFTSGMLSPILNALRPDEFVLIAAPGRAVLNHFWGCSLTTALSDYSTANSAARQLVTALDPVMKAATFEGIRPVDVFEGFCHWLVNRRMHPLEGAGAHDPGDEAAGLGVFPTSLVGIRPMASELPPEPVASGPAEAPDAATVEPRAESAPESATGSATGSAPEAPPAPPAREPAGAAQDTSGPDAPDADASDETAETDPMHPAARRDEPAATARHDTAPAARSAAPATDPVAARDVVTAPRAPVVQHAQDVKYAPGVEHARDVHAAGSVPHALPSAAPAAPLAPPATPVTLASNGAGGAHAPPARRRPVVESVREPELVEPPLFDEDAEPDAGDGGGDAHAAGESVMARCLAALERKGQIVLHGPPGSGKGRLARRLAARLVEGGDGLRGHVAFHANWTYEDFIQQQLPDGQRRLGRFTAFCRKAAGRRGCSVLVIEDMQRARVADVLGEALVLLEQRGSEITLAGGGSLVIPPRVRLIATVDSSQDGGVLSDGLLRQRFAFVPVEPGTDAAD